MWSYKAISVSLVKEDTMEVDLGISAGFDGIGFGPREKEELLRRLGARLRALRGAAGLSLRELGNRTGLDNSKLAKIEKGRINITYLTLCALSDGLGIPVRELLRS